MASTPIIGKNFIVAVGVETIAGTSVTPTKRLDIISESLKENVSIDQTDRLRGHLQKQHGVIQAVRKDVQGMLEMPVRPTELDVISKAIMGGTKDSNYYPYAETAESLTVEVDRVAKVYTYAGCHVKTAKFSASSGSILRLALELLGMTCVEGAAASGTDLDYGLEAPFLMSHLAILLDSGSVEGHDIELTIDRQPEEEHFGNSLTRTSAASTGFVVTGQVTLDYNTTNVAVRTKLISKATATLKATFTNGSYIFELECPKIVYTGEETTGDGADARRIVLPFEAFRTEGETPVDNLLYKLVTS